MLDFSFSVLSKLFEFWIGFFKRVPLTPMGLLALLDEGLDVVEGLFTHFFEEGDFLLGFFVGLGFFFFFLGSFDHFFECADFYSVAD